MTYNFQTLGTSTHEDFSDSDTYATEDLYLEYEMGYGSFSEFAMLRYWCIITASTNKRSCNALENKMGFAIS